MSSTPSGQGSKPGATRRMVLTATHGDVPVALPYRRRGMSTALCPRRSTRHGFSEWMRARARRLELTTVPVYLPAWDCFTSSTSAGCTPAAS